VIESKAQAHAAVGEFRGMGDGDGVIGFGVQVDEHGAVAQVDLLVALRPAFAVGAPALAGFVDLVLGFDTFEVVLEDEFTEVVGGLGRGEAEQRGEEQVGLHGRVIRG